MSSTERPAGATTTESTGSTTTSSRTSMATTTTRSESATRSVSAPSAVSRDLSSTPKSATGGTSTSSTIAGTSSGASTTSGASTVDSSGASSSSDDVSGSSSKASSSLPRSLPMDATQAAAERPRHHRLVLMRNAERLDRIFPSWTRHAFADNSGRYRPYDLNQPLTVPTRPAADFHNDPPLTEMGAVSAQMVGRGLRLRHLPPAVIYCSPALRCVQTARAVLKTAGEATIRVEPGLFEWLAWYETPPRWMSVGDLRNYYPIDDTYKPLCSTDGLLDCRRESVSQHYERCASVVEQLVARHPGQVVLVVGHASTVDACVQRLLGRTPPTLERHHLDRLGLHYPYCATATLAPEGRRWKLQTDALPPITYLDFSNRIDMDFLQRAAPTVLNARPQQPSAELPVAGAALKTN